MKFFFVVLFAAFGLVLVLEDVRGLRQPPDIAATLRRQLGMAE